MKNHTLLFSISLCLLVLWACKSPTTTELINPAKTKALSIPNPSALDNILDKYIKEGFYPFVYARLEDLEGNLLYEHSTVNKKLLPNTTIDGDSWMRVWSMSKIITISIALDLIEEGVLQFNDPVVKFIPEFKNLQVAVAEGGKQLTEFEWGKRENTCPYDLVPLDSVMTVLHLINHEAGFYYATTGIACLDSLVATKNLPLSTNKDAFILCG